MIPKVIHTYHIHYGMYVYIYTIYIEREIDRKIQREREEEEKKKKKNKKKKPWLVFKDLQYHLEGKVHQGLFGMTNSYQEN